MAKTSQVFKLLIKPLIYQFDLGAAVTWGKQPIEICLSDLIVLRSDYMGSLWKLVTCLSIQQNPTQLPISSTRL